MLLHLYAVMLLHLYAVMLLHLYAVMLLHLDAVMLLHLYAVMLLHLDAVMLLLDDSLDRRTCFAAVAKDRGLAESLVANSGLYRHERRVVVCGISEAQQGIYDIAAVQQVNKAYGLAFEVLPAFVGGGKKSVAADLRARQSFEEGISAPRIRIAAAFSEEDPKLPLQQNTVAGREAELTSVNMHCNARSMAKITALMANQGEFEGIRLLSAASVAAALEKTRVDKEVSMDMICGFTQGGFSTTVSFAYAMTAMGPEEVGGARTCSLVAAANEAAAETAGKYTEI
eukprot:gene4550-9399_t